MPRQPRPRKRPRRQSPPVKRKTISQKRQRRHIRQRNLPLARQLMPARQHQHIPPFPKRQLAQILPIPRHIHRQSQIHLPIKHHPHQFRRAALLQHQTHIRKQRPKPRQHTRQPETQQSMSRPQRKRPALRLCKLPPDILNIAHPPQHLLRRLQNRHPHLRNRHNPLAATNKNLHPQLILQQPNLLRHPGLRSKQRLRRLRHIQIMAKHLHRITQLLQLHHIIPKTKTHKCNTPPNTTQKQAPHHRLTPPQQPKNHTILLHLCNYTAPQTQKYMTKNRYLGIVKPQRATSQTQKTLTGQPQILIVSIGKNLGSRRSFIQATA